MTEERITRTTDEAGNTHTTHTVVSDGERHQQQVGHHQEGLQRVLLAVGVRLHSPEREAESYKSHVTSYKLQATG